MSQFYARYVPPTMESEAANGTSPSQKRKRTDHEEPVAEKVKKQKKAKDGLTRKSSIENLQQNVSTQTEKPSEVEADLVRQHIPDRRSTSPVTRDKPDKDAPASLMVQNGDGLLETPDGDIDIDSVQPPAKQKREKKKGKKELTDAQEVDDAAIDAGYSRQHSRILSKFSKSKDAQPLDAKQSASGVHSSPQDPNLPSVVVHGLEPLPQPEEVHTEPQKPQFSVLPAWQSGALQVASDSTKPIESMGVSQILLDNLSRVGIHTAFPVQSAVIPLLLPGQARYDGDLCVSAATGSGKTLAYVLPLVEAIKDASITKLRGLIVVPTRELVKQVRQTCELCAAGTNLKIATAAGSKSLRSERESLVCEEEIYSPKEDREFQKSPINWSDFSLEDLVRRAGKQGSFGNIDMIRVFRSKVDILITTPGRLVEHLQSTPGFSLDDVRWLVVDEADRLLNESYQEWVESVVPALQSRAATKAQDDMLRYMRMEPRPRKVTKILLSATMTRDVSKLKSLGLRNPKLVSLDSSTTTRSGMPGNDTIDEQDPEDPVENPDGAFQLPHALSEAVVPLKDASDKPLILLELLKQHVRTSESGETATSRPLVSLRQEASESDSTSDSDSDSVFSEDSLSEDSDSENHPSFESSPTKERPKPSSDPLHATKSKLVKVPRALIFTRSTASALRLSRLLCLISPELSQQILTLTRSTNSSASARRAFTSFRNSSISILIATDRASRGLDVPDLEHVISYDIPSSVLTYVHRVGRTARAGKSGQAWTLVEHQQGKWFWETIGGKSKAVIDGPTISRSGKVRKVQVTVDNDELRARYEKALAQLGEEVRE